MEDDPLSYWHSQEDDWNAARSREAIPGMGAYRKGQPPTPPRQKSVSPEETATRRLWGVEGIQSSDGPAQRRKDAVAACRTHKDWLRLIEQTYRAAFGELPVKGQWALLTKAYKLLEADVPHHREVYLWAISRLGREAGDGTPPRRVLAYCQELARLGKKRKALREWERLPLVVAAE